MILPISDNMKIMDYSKDHFVCDFKLQIKEQLCINTTESPIIWKTTPSRKNSNIGQYLMVNIDSVTLPTYDIKEENVDTGHVVTKKTRDNFWQSFKYNLTDGTLCFAINIRHFMIHVLVNRHHQNNHPKNYNSNEINLLLKSEEAQNLDILSWFNSDSREFKSVSKSAGKNCKDDRKRDIIFNKCVSLHYIETFDTSLIDEQNQTKMNDTLFSCISPDIVQYLLLKKNKQ